MTSSTSAINWVSSTAMWRLPDHLIRSRPSFNLTTSTGKHCGLVSSSIRDQLILPSINDPIDQCGEAAFHPPRSRETHEECGSSLNNRSDLDHLSRPSLGRVRDDSKLNRHTEPIRNSDLWLDCWNTARLESATAGERGGRRPFISCMCLLHVSVVIMLKIKPSARIVLSITSSHVPRSRCIWKLSYPSGSGKYLENQSKWNSRAW